MLEDDEPRGLGAREPLLHVRRDGGERRAAARNTPVLRVLVPDDGGKSEDLAPDRGHTRVDVTVRRAPEARELAVSRIVDDLHRPSELRDDLLVRERRHVGVGVCVHSDVVVEIVVGRQEGLPVV